MRKLYRFDKETQRMVEISTGGNYVEAPFVEPDEIPPQKSHASFDSPVFTSRAKKRAYEASLGFIEAGPNYNPLDYGPRGPTSHERDQEDRREKDAIVKDLMDIKYDRVKFSEKEKEQHLRENRKWGTLKNPY